MPTTNRIDKVNSLLEHEISKIILRDFDFSNILVTLTRVDTSANLIEAKVYISIFPDDKAEDVIKKLNASVYSVQKKIDKLLNMRPIPKIKFVKDENIKSASRVEELLASIDARRAELKNQQK